jgi:hypothetical protein
MRHYIEDHERHARLSSPETYSLPDKFRLNLLDRVLRHLIGSRNFVRQLFVGNRRAVMHLCHLSNPFTLKLSAFASGLVGKRQRALRSCKEKLLKIL